MQFLELAITMYTLSQSLLLPGIQYPRVRYYQVQYPRASYYQLFSLPELAITRYSVS
jgi:hypothetical protein